MGPTFDRPRLHVQLLEHMTRLIATGLWTPSTVLPAEGELAQQFKVSRTVVRECVRVLAARGMLDVRQGRGIVVLPHADWKVTEPLALLVRSDRASLLDWLEVRTLLEMDSAGLAAQRVTHDEQEALYQLLRGQETSEGAPDTYRDLDIQFHLAIAHATRNPALVRLLEGVIQPLREQLEERSLSSQTRHASTDEHRAIVVCLAGHDPSGAREAMARHLSRVANEVIQVLGEENSATTLPTSEGLWPATDGARRHEAPEAVEQQREEVQGAR